jgi:hypothetical protein
MKQALSSVFKTRSTLIATYLCVCSLSVGVTLTLLNIYLIVVLICFMVATMCAGSIVKDVNKQYWSKKHLVFYVKRKNGKTHIERSKVYVKDQGRNRKLVWIRFPQRPFEHESDTVSKDTAMADEDKDEKSLGASLQEQVEREGIEMKQQNSTKGKDQLKS